MCPARGNAKRRRFSARCRQLALHPLPLRKWRCADDNVSNVTAHEISDDHRFAQACSHQIRDYRSSAISDHGHRHCIDRYPLALRPVPLRLKARGQCPSHRNLSPNRFFLTKPNFPVPRGARTVNLSRRCEWLRVVNTPCRKKYG